MKKLTKTETAKKLGVTRRTVYNLVKRGTLVPDENGLITLNGDSIADEGENAATNSQSVKRVLESSERLKDKYITQLEKQVDLLKRQNDFQRFFERDWKALQIKTFELYQDVITERREKLSLLKRLRYYLKTVIGIAVEGKPISHDVIDEWHRECERLISLYDTDQIRCLMRQKAE